MIRNNKSPNIDPCVSPVWIELLSDISPSYVTYCHLSVKLFLINSNVGPLNPYVSILCNSILWTRVSNTFFTSITVWWCVSFFPDVIRHFAYCMKKTMIVSGPNLTSWKTIFWEEFIQLVAQNVLNSCSNCPQQTDWLIIFPRIFTFS